MLSIVESTLFDIEYMVYWQTYTTFAKSHEPFITAPLLFWTCIAPSDVTRIVNGDGAVLSFCKIHVPNAQVFPIGFGAVPIFHISQEEKSPQLQSKSKNTRFPTLIDALLNVRPPPVIVKFIPVFAVMTFILLTAAVTFPIPFSMLFRESDVIAVPDVLVSVQFFLYKIKPYVFLSSYILLVKNL